MATVIPETDPRRDHSCYWFHVVHIREAARIEGRTPGAYSEIDADRLVLSSMQEASADLESGMFEVETLIAEALEVDSIDCLWSPAIGTIEDPSSFETFVYLGEITESPAYLSCWVAPSLGAWKAQVNIASRSGTVEYSWEACLTQEHGLLWCQKVCADWLRVNSVFLLWESLEISDGMRATVRLRRPSRHSDDF